MVCRIEEDANVSKPRKSRIHSVHIKQTISVRTLIGGAAVAGAAVVDAGALFVVGPFRALLFVSKMFTMESKSVYGLFLCDAGITMPSLRPMTTKTATANTTERLGLPRVIHIMQIEGFLELDIFCGDPSKGRIRS